MKRTKVAAIVVSALFALGLIAPAIIVNSGGPNPGLIYMASNFGTQSNIPAKITGTNLTNITILHTNDIHSHFLPWPVADYKPGTGNDASVGGMSRIAYLVNKTRNEAVEPVLLFDAGDFLMGTPLEWVGMLPGAASGYSVELDVLANLSYDAVAIGNHEWDYGVLGLSYILANTSINAPYGLPPLLCSNLNLSTPRGYDYLGIGTYIKDNLTIDIGSLRIGVFSVIGYGASAVEFFVPVSGYSFSDPIQIAQQEVAWFTQNGTYDLIICLSHSGWEEDLVLAKQAPGIDLILGGHDHYLLETPLYVTTSAGNTTILDAESYSRYLGYLEMTVNDNENPGQGIYVRNYTAIKIDDSIPEYAPLSAVLAPGIGLMNYYLTSILGLPAYDTVIANTTVDIPGYGTKSTSGGMMSATAISARHTPTHWIPPEPDETPTGDLVADAVRWAIENITGDYVDFGFEVTGIIRQGLVTQTGNITVYDAMSVLPMGWWNFPSGPYWGWTFCSFYLYGWEIKRALEMSVFLKGDYFFQVSGLRFWYSDLRMPGDRVMKIELLTENGNWTTLDTSTSNTTLYLVGCSLQETAVMENLYAQLEAAGAPFFRVYPKFDNGTVMTNLPADTILFNGGLPYPESKYFSLFLANLTAEHGSIPSIYGAPQGRINKLGINPVDIFTITGLGQIIAGQQASSNLVYGGITCLILIMIVAAAVIAARRP